MKNDHDWNLWLSLNKTAVHPSGVRALAGAVKLSMRKWWSRQQPAQRRGEARRGEAANCQHTRAAPCPATTRSATATDSPMCSSNSSSSSTPLYSGWVASIKNKKGEKETEGALDLSPWRFHAGLCAALCTRRLSSWQHRGVRVVTAINMKGKTLNHCFILSFSLWWECGGGGVLWICRCPCGGAKPLASRDFLAPCLERGHTLRSAPLPATPAHPPHTDVGKDWEQCVEKTQKRLFHSLWRAFRVALRLDSPVNTWLVVSAVTENDSPHRLDCAKWSSWLSCGAAPDVAKICSDIISKTFQRRQRNGNVATLYNTQRQYKPDVSFFFIYIPLNV